jgi:acetolactate synthase-1/2/3 large subunit
MRKMTGADALAAMFSGYGLTHFFMVPAVLRRTMRELERSTGIKRINTHGEKAAAYMADGYARASGRPGVCGAQVVGALNLAAGLRDAYLACAPVIAMTGGRDPSSKYRGVYQEVDDLPAFEPVTKFNAAIDDVSRFPDMLRQAFRASVSGCPGPVHLQFRGNEGQIDADSAEMDPYVEEQFSALAPFRVEPSPANVRKCLDLLTSASRPIIVAGGGVRASSAKKALVAFAERAGIPVATSLNGKDSIPGNHELSVGVVGSYSRASANNAVHEADLVCFIGTRTGSMTTHSWQVPKPGTAAIQIDIDPDGLGRNYPLKLAIQADAQRVLVELYRLCPAGAASRTHEWRSRCHELVSTWRGEYYDRLTSSDVPIRPERICHELTRAAPDDAIIVADTGHGGVWMGGVFDIRTEAQSYIRSAGHLGWAFPAGLGAKCACPDRPVITFTGDAGLWYHLAEIETAVRWNLNVVTIVNNNHSGNQSKRGFDRVYEGQQTDDARKMWTFVEVNFAEIAEAVGATGIRVEKPADIADAIERGLSANGPVVIDVATDIDILAPLGIVP